MVSIAPQIWGLVVCLCSVLVVAGNHEVPDVPPTPGLRQLSLPNIVALPIHQLEDRILQPLQYPLPGTEPLEQDVAESVDSPIYEADSSRTRRKKVRHRDFNFEYTANGGSRTGSKIPRSQIMFIFGQPDEERSDEKYKLYDITEPEEEIDEDGRLVTIDLRNFKDENQKMIAKHILARLNRFSDASLEERVGPFLTKVTRRYKSDSKEAKSIKENLHDNNQEFIRGKRQGTKKPEYNSNKEILKSGPPKRFPSDGRDPYFGHGKSVEDSMRHKGHFGPRRPFPTGPRLRRLRNNVKVGGERNYGRAENYSKKPKRGGFFKLPSSYMRDSFKQVSKPHNGKHGKHLPDLYSHSNFEDLPVIDGKYSGYTPSLDEGHEDKEAPPVYFYDKPQKYFHTPKSLESFDSRPSFSSHHKGKEFGRAKIKVNKKEPHYGSSDYHKGDFIRPPVKAVVRHGKDSFGHPTVKAVVKPGKSLRSKAPKRIPFEDHHDRPLPPYEEPSSTVVIFKRRNKKTSRPWYLQGPMSWLG